MIGLDESDVRLIDRAVIALLFCGGVLALGWLLTGCAAAEPAVPVGIEGAAFRAELAECRERSSTCPGYVACRARVEAAHGRTYRGRCEP